MKTFFYNRTCYRATQSPIPECFLILDEYYDSKVNKHSEAYNKYYGINAENICRRMADIEFYSMLIKQAIEDQNAFIGVIVASSFMIGLFSSCKSLLDAAAITLNDIYKLELAYKDQDFNKGKFWNVLYAMSSTISKKYEVFRSLSKDVVKWRDAAIHRHTPILTVHCAEDPTEHTPRSSLIIRMVDEPDSIHTLKNLLSFETKWLEPLDLYDKWHPQFIKLCEFLCCDICNVTSD